MNTVIRTLQQVQQAQAEAWVYGLIVAGVALALAIAIAFMINWRSDRKDFITRRIWFIVIGLVAPASYWLYNAQVVAPRIQNPGFKNMFGLKPVSRSGKGGRLLWPRRWRLRSFRHGPD